MIARLLIAFALAGALLTSQAWAAAGDDQYAIAAGHYARGRWELAAEEFNLFLKDFPDHPKRLAGSFFAAEALVQLGQLEAARQKFQTLLAEDPQNRYVKQAIFRAGEASYLLNDHEGAQRELLRFQELYPDDALNAYVLPYLGEIALDRGELEKARQLFDKGLAQFPEGPLQDDCRYGVARVVERQGAAEEAGRMYLALASKTSSPLADDAQFRLGAVQYERAEYAAAIATFESFEGDFKDSPLKPRARLGRGWAMFQLGQNDKAARFFKALVNTPSVSDEASYWLGLTQKAQQDFDAAAETLETAAETNPESEFSPAMLFHAGDALLRGGKADEADALFERLLASEPKDWADDALLGRMQAALSIDSHADVDAYYAEFNLQFPQSTLRPEAERILARSLIARDDFAQAIALLEPLAAGAAAEPSDHYLLAVALAGARRHADALTQLGKIAADASETLRMDAALAQANSLVALERYEEAIPLLEQFLAARPKDTDTAKCRAQLAICYGQTKQIEKARQVFDDLVAKHPGDALIPPTTQHLAEAVLEAGDHAWAEELFASLDAGAPTDYAAKGLSGRAWTQYKAGQLKEAAATFERLLKDFPNDPVSAEAALARGQILEKLNDSEPALAAYQLALTQYPESPQQPKALLAAARLHVKLGQETEAAGLYEQYVKANPQAADMDAALYHWAWALKKLGKAPEADALFERVHQEFPQSPFWPDATYRLAEQAHQAKDYDRANGFLDKLLATTPPPAIKEFALYLQGQIAIGRQRWDEVAPPLTKLIEEFPEGQLRLLAEYRIAEALYRQGEYDQAMEALDQLVPKIEGRSDAWTALVPLRRAQILAQRRSWTEALELALTIETEYPGFAQQYEADYVIGRALASRGQFNDAREAYQKVVRSPQGEGTETAAMAQWMIGESHFHQKDYKTALREFLKVEILYAYPTWQAAALLEAGKCHEFLGEWNQAAETYERLVKDFSTTVFVEEANKRLAAAKAKQAQRPQPRG